MRRFKFHLAATVASAVVAAVAAWLVLHDTGGDGPRLDGPMAAFQLFDAPRSAPEITFSDAAGNSLSLADFSGRVVLVNLWATWCVPCVEEMPSLDRLQADLGGDDFTVVTLSVDRGGAEQVLPFFDSNGIAHLSPYFDPEGLAPRAFAARGFPTTVLIDEAGCELGTMAGPAEWDSRDALSLISAAVGAGN